MKHTLSIVLLVIVVLAGMSIAPKMGTGIDGSPEISREVVINAPIPDVREYPCYKIIDEEYEKWSKPELMKIKKSISSEDEAVDIANQYIQDHGGFPEGAYLYDVESIHVRRTNQTDGRVMENEPINVKVTYNRLIDGAPVVGSGDTIVVSVGEDGEILCFFKNWRELEKVGNKEMIPVQEALEVLKKGEKLENAMENIESIEINKIEVGYFPSETGSEQEFYEPVWIFRGVDSNGHDVIKVIKEVAE